MSIFRRTTWMVLLLGAFSTTQTEAQDSAEIRAHLEAKSNEYIANLRAHHLREEQVISLRTGGGIDEEGDAATYTAYYVAAEAWRFRATGDEQAYLNLSQGLDALHNLQSASGEPGTVSRFVQGGMPWTGSRTFTSKDVYTAVLFAYSNAWPALREGPLKERVRADVLAIGDRFLQDGFAFVSASRGLFLDLHPRLSRSELEYLLEKDPASVRASVKNLRLFGQEYAILDNLLGGRARDYLSDLLARWDSLEATGGATASGAWCERFANGFLRDPARCHYRTAFTKDEIQAVRDLFDALHAALKPLQMQGNDLDTPQTPESTELHEFLAELFNAVDEGRDLAPVFERHWERGFPHLLNRIVALLRGLPARLPAFSKFLVDLFGSESRPDYFFYWLDKQAGNGGLDASHAALLRKLFSNIAGTSAALARYVSFLPAQISAPEELVTSPANALLLLHVLKVVSQVTGEPRFAQAYDQQRESLLPLARSLAVAEEDVLTTAFGDQAADAQRAEGTHQLKWLALYDLLTLEQDSGVRAAYREILEGEFAYVRDELNSFANFIHTVRSGRVDGLAYAQGVQSLYRFPRYGTGDFEYSCADAYVQNELGGCIQFLGGEILSRKPIPLDRRPRDASTWQRSPRRLSNRNPGHVFAGVDFLLAYWLGRAHGLLDELPDDILQIGSEPERVPLLRFYHFHSGDHFYTLDEAHALEALRVGYVSEGQVGYVRVAAGSGGIPLYRLYHNGFGDHFYTTDPDERNRALGLGYVSEGIEGYLSSQPIPGTIPLFRLYHNGLGDHFYTQDAAERDRALGFGYVLETTPGFIWVERESEIGLDVRVRPIEPGTGRAPVALTFAQIVADGETRLSVGSSGPAAPAGFDLGSPPLYYEVSTDAQFAGPVEICIDYSGVTYANEWSLRLLHFENALWRDITSSRDTSRHLLCGITGSFSPFVVTRDAAPPVSSAVLSQPANAAGWHRHDLVLTLAAQDNGGNGGLEISHTATGAQAAPTQRDVGPAISLPITLEGVTAVVFFAEDSSGNVEAPRSTTLRLDRTPPQVTYSGNLASYTVDLSVEIHCAAADSLSGLASASCEDVLGPAYTFGLGEHTFGAEATDVAGNHASATATFEVRVTFGSLCNLTRRFVSQPGVATSLCSKLSAAEAAAVRGNVDAKEAQLNAYSNQVRAQTGKSLSAEPATVLLELVEAL